MYLGFIYYLLSLYMSQPSRIIQDIKAPTPKKGKILGALGAILIGISYANSATDSVDIGSLQDVINSTAVLAGTLATIIGGSMRK